MLKVVDIECIRKLHFKEGWSIRKIAKELGHARKTVRKALKNAGPWEYRLTEPRAKPVTGPVLELIRSWLVADQSAPKKQRHTARRIYERLCAEYGFQGSESSIRRVVAQLRREVEAVPVDPYFVLRSAPGEMAQVDWGQAKVVLNGELTVVKLFCLRLHHSGVSFVWAALHERLEAFLEGHVRAFAWLGGVPEKIVYDNLSTVVRRIIQGRRERELNERFITMRSHYVFDSVFANPGAGHEKGSVEHLVGYVRRNVLTPVPQVASLEELNALLQEWCQQQRARRQEAWEEERSSLGAIPAGSFKPCVIHHLPVNKLSLVTFQRNRYSVPARHIGGSVRAEVYADRIELFDRDRLLAVHPRPTGRHHTLLQLEHFLEALARKPYAVTHAAVVRDLPEPYATLREHLLARDPNGYRELVTILLLHREFSADQVKAAIREALATGWARAENVRQALLNAQHRPPHSHQSGVDGPHVPVGDPRRYDALVGVSGA